MTILQIKKGDRKIIINCILYLWGNNLIDLAPMGNYRIHEGGNIEICLTEQVVKIGDRLSYVRIVSNERIWC
jgi:hypothetical protein